MAENKRGKLIAFLFLIILGICWFEPIVWLITNSFKFDADFITSFANIQGPMDYLSRLIPTTWTTSNYTELFFGGENVNTNANIGLMFQNSFIVSITVTLCTVFITSLSAYAYERLDFKGGDKIFWTLMYMSMFPNVVAILPQFRIANALGWVNNLNALIWPMLAGVFNIFLIRNFMKSIPKALDEAATIDGASRIQKIRYISIPSIMGTIIIMLLLRCGQIMNIGYEKVLLLYNTNTYVTADVVSTFAQRYGLEGAQKGLASAAEMMNNVVSMLLVISANTIARKASDTSLY